MIYSEDLYLNCDFPMVIEECSFFQKPDTHSLAFLKGYVDQEKLTEIRRMAPVYICRKRDNAIIFAGVIKEYEITVSYKHNNLRLTIISGTWLLDQEKRIVSYQQKRSYTSLIQELISDSAQALYSVQDKMIEGLLVQYEESNWEFVKRLASHLETFIIPDINSSVKGRFYIGLRNGELIDSIKIHNYKEQFDSRYYEVASGIKSKHDYVRYWIQSYEDYSIGDFVIWKHHKFFICEKKARLKGGILIFEYLLASDTYMKTSIKVNHNLHGREIPGVIIKTTGELLKLKLKTDSHSEAIDFYYCWMPETGNLMYCMPEKGTWVSLYFCDNSESSAICINCMRVNLDDDTAYWNPKQKQFRTHEYQRLLFKKNQLAIYSMNSYLLLGKENGVVIKTQKALDIQAMQEVFIEADIVLVNSPKEIDLIKEDLFDPTIIVLKNNFDSKGKAARIVPKIWYSDKPIPERIFDKRKDLERDKMAALIMGMVVRR